MGGAAAGHLPVMVEEVLDLFAPALQPTGAILVDATLGRAGHARALLDAHPGLVLIGVDTDTPGDRGVAAAARPVRRPGHPGPRRLRRAP